MTPPDKDIILACEHVHHWFGAKRVLHDVDLLVQRGQLLALVGPSGCGKSTLLQAIVGTHPPRQGRILTYRGVDPSAQVVQRPGRDRGIVYQRYSLFPFLTAQENVAVGLMLDETGLAGRMFKFAAWRRLRKQHLRHAAELLEKLGLLGAIDCYPHELSGGMRQRVAVAQALIDKPHVLLLDEPFGALDAAMREELQRMLLTLYQENVQARRRGAPSPYTMVLVTHELNEALYVGDRVVGLSQYWNWSQAGHATCPGATVVYDDRAPVFEPDEEPDFGVLAAQRDEIRRAVFDPHVLTDPAEFRRYWKRSPGELKLGSTGKQVDAPQHASS